MSLQAACVSVLLIVATCAYGQEQPGSRHITGKDGAAGAQVLINEINTEQYPRVRIFVSVLREGTPLRGLEAADFRVREDEVDQEPLTVEPRLPPLSVVLTLDTSGSMAKRMQETRTAASRFLDTLGREDSAQVVTFAREVKRLTAMSTDRQVMREAIGKTVARGDTALYDALYDSIRLAQDRAGRKAIVLLSDGVDDDGTGKPLSKHTVQDVIRLARDVNVPIYILGLGTDINEAGLTAIAQATGALYFKAPQASDLQALYETIGAQLAGQYAIAYTSNLPADGTEHRVVLATKGVTDTKSYKAPGNSGTVALGHPLARSGDAPCYDAAAVQSVEARLRKIAERYNKGLLDITERDEQRQQLVNDFDHLMAQGSGTAACLVTHAGMRATAIDLQAEALDAFVVDGVEHNIPFLAALMQHPRWREGRLSTGFIAEEYKGGFKPRVAQGEELDILAAVAVAIDHLANVRRREITDQMAGPAVRFSSRRIANVGGALVAARVEGILGQPANVTLVDAKGIRRTTLDVDADWWPGNPLWRGHVGKRPVSVQVRPILNGYDLAYRGIRAKAYVYTEREAALVALMPEKVAPDTSKLLLCPMPGLVKAIHVAQGQEVKAGEALCVVEAMKMENILRAERDGVVKAIKAKPGDSLAVDAVIMEFA